MLMNTMEALGTGLNLSSKSETPGLNLGADAEALALFASLFAMMQTPQKDGATAGPVPPDTAAVRGDQAAASCGCYAHDGTGTYSIRR